MDVPDRTAAKSWEGSDVVDRDGQRIGRCTSVFADTDTGVTEWLTIDVEGRRTFVPALGATGGAEQVQVPFARSDVLSAPQVGDDQQLGKNDEVLLYRHYEVAHTATSTGSVLPAGPEPLLGSPASTITPAPSMPPLSAAPLPPSATMDAGAPDPAPEVAAPLRPAPEPLVTPLPVAARPAPSEPASPRSSPVSEPASPVTASSPGGAPLAPLAVVAGLVAAVGLGLKAWERRAERRRAPAARAARLSKAVRAGTAAAAQNAGKHLSSLPDTASATTRDASRSGRRLAAATTDSATRTGRSAKKRASGLASATAGAAAGTSRSASRTASRKSKRLTSKGSRLMKKANKRTSRGSSTLTSSVSTVPSTVAKKGRRVKRTVVGNVWDVVIMAGTGAGYVLGARAGRERYEQINQQASELASSPQVQAVTRAVTDPDRREKVIGPVRSAINNRRPDPAA